MALKDHVRASGCADRAGFRDEVLPYVVSATIKAPGSASLLPVTFGSEGSLARSFGQFVATSRTSSAPPWLVGPVRTIATLVERVYRLESCDVPELLRGTTA